MTAIFALTGREPDYVQVLRNPSGYLEEAGVSAQARSVLVTAVEPEPTARFATIDALAAALVGAQVRADIVHDFVDFIDDKTGVSFVAIPAGDFKMGSERSPDERPIHPVRLTSAFWLGKYPLMHGRTRFGE